MVYKTKLTNASLTQADVISSIEAFRYRDGPYLEVGHCALARKQGWPESKIAQLAQLWQGAGEAARDELATIKARFSGIGGRFEALRPKIDEAKKKLAEEKAKEAEPEAAEKPKMVWHKGRRYPAEKMVTNNAGASFILPATQPKVESSGKDTASLAATVPKRKEEPEAEEQQAEPIKSGLPAVIPPVPLPSKWDDAIVAMNEQHAVIDNVGGKTVIASWEPSQIDPARLMVVFQGKDSFLLRYSNRTVTIEAPLRDGIRYVKVPLGQWWLAHRDRSQFRGVIFRPGSEKVVNDCLNLWQGWGVVPKSGDWRLIRRHIERIIASGDAEFAQYVVRWIAWAIQNPAAQAEVALVLIGAKGAGKGTLVRCLQRIFGAHTFQVTSREEVIGKFNGHLQDCVLFIADEAYWGGDKRCVGRLQGMITEPWLPIERKGFDLIEVPNYLHVVMLAEPGWVIPAGRYERRYAALSVSDGKRGDREYFKALHHQIANGGAEAMMWDLQEMDVADWHPREIPESLLKGAALQEQQVHTLPPFEQWYLMLLHDGAIPGAYYKKLNTSLTRSLLDDARERIPRLRYETDVALRNFLSDAGRLGVVCTKFRTAYANGWSFPPLSECREAFAKLYGPQDWDNSDAEDWEYGGLGSGG